MGGMTGDFHVTREDLVDWAEGTRELEEFSLGLLTPTELLSLGKFAVQAFNPSVLDSVQQQAFNQAVYGLGEDWAIKYTHAFSRLDSLTIPLDARGDS